MAQYNGRGEEMWQQRERQMWENMEMSDLQKANLSAAKDEKAALTRLYLDLRHAGKSEKEAFDAVRLQAGRPNLSLQVYDEDMGDLADLELMFG